AFENETVEEPLAGRPGIFGTVSHPDVRHLPVAGRLVVEVSPAPHQVRIAGGVGFMDELRQTDAGLAGHAQVDDEQLQVVGVGRAAGWAAGGGGGSTKWAGACTP